MSLFVSQDYFLINIRKTAFLNIESVHKVPFTSLRSPKNYLFTISKLRIFGLRKPCKWNFLNREIAY
jgi:hypothetical protein